MMPTRRLQAVLLVTGFFTSVSAWAQVSPPVMNITSAGAIFALGGAPDARLQVDALTYKTSCDSTSFVTADGYSPGFSTSWNVDTSACGTTGDPCTIEYLHATGCQGARNYLCLAADQTHFVVGSACTPVPVLWMTNVIFILNPSPQLGLFPVIGKAYADTVQNDQVFLDTSSNVSFHNLFLGGGFPVYLLDTSVGGSSAPTVYYQSQVPFGKPFPANGLDSCWAQINKFWPYIPVCRWTPSQGSASARYDALIANDQVNSDFPGGKTWFTGVKMASGQTEFLTFSTSVNTAIQFDPCVFGSSRCPSNQWVQAWDSSQGPEGLGQQLVHDYRMANGGNVMIGSSSVGNVSPVYWTAAGAF